MIVYLPGIERVTVQRIEVSNMAAAGDTGLASSTNSRSVERQGDEEQNLSNVTTWSGRAREVEEDVVVQTVVVSIPGSVKRAQRRRLHGAATHAAGNETDFHDGLCDCCSDAETCGAGVRCQLS